MSGVTVHLVTADLDAGPIILQRTVPVLEGDTEESLAARILVEEHQAYPEAVQRVLDGAMDCRWPPVRDPVGSWLKAHGVVWLRLEP